MEDLYLAHHGIEGQRWGRRNGPPYPLNAQGKKKFATWARTKREKHKAGKAISRSIKKQQKTKDSYRIKVNHMTDHELEAATKRLKAEAAYQDAVNNAIKNKQTYAQLTYKPTKSDKIAAFLGNNADKILKTTMEETSKLLKGYLEKNKPKSRKDILKEKTAALNAEKDLNEAIVNYRNSVDKVNNFKKSDGKSYSKVTKYKDENGKDITLTEIWGEQRGGKK